MTTVISQMSADDIETVRKTASTIVQRIDELTNDEDFSFIGDIYCQEGWTTMVAGMRSLAANTQMALDTFVDPDSMTDEQFTIINQLLALANHLVSTLR